MMALRSTTNRGSRRFHVIARAETKRRLRQLRSHTFSQNDAVGERGKARSAPCCAEIRAIRRRNEGESAPSAFSWMRTWGAQSKQRAQADLKTRFYKGRMYVLTPTVSAKPDYVKTAIIPADTGTDTVESRLGFFAMCLIFGISFGFSALVLFVFTVFQ